MTLVETEKKLIRDMGQIIDRRKEDIRINILYHTEIIKNKKSELEIEYKHGVMMSNRYKYLLE